MGDTDEVTTDPDFLGDDGDRVQRCDTQAEIIPSRCEDTSPTVETMMQQTLWSKPPNLNLPGVVCRASKSCQSFKLLFRDLSGHAVSVECTGTDFPLQISFKGCSPVKISQVDAGGNGDKLGMRVGWGLLRFDDVDIEFCDAAEIRTLLQDASHRISLGDSSEM